MTIRWMIRMASGLQKPPAIIQNGFLLEDLINSHQPSSRFHSCHAFHEIDLFHGKCTTVCYFHFNSWLSFQQLCHVLWGYNNKCFTFLEIQLLLRYSAAFELHPASFLALKLNKNVDRKLVHLNMSINVMYNKHLTHSN